MRQGGLAITHTRTYTAVLTILITTGAMWYLVKPPLTDSAYDERARQTLSSLSSQVQTARLWGRELGSGNTPLLTARVGLEEVSADASGYVNQFSNYQPPGGRRELRDRVDSLGRRVASRLDSLRVEAQSGDLDSVVRDASKLDALLGDLTDLRSTMG